MKENEEILESGIKRRKWFDKGVFNDDFSDDSSVQSEDAGELDVPNDSDIEQDDDSIYDEEDKKKNKGFVNPLKKSHLSSKQEYDDEDVNFGSDNEDEGDNNNNGYIDMYDDDIYIGKRPKSGHEDVNPNETVPGELSDDDAYVI